MKNSLFSWSRVEAAEALGTFLLTFVVGVALVAQAPMVPAIAGLTLALIVYTIGPISGAHVNPAVTIGLLAAKVINPTVAVRYVIAQIIGAGVALAASWYLTGITPSASIGSPPSVMIGEAIGAFILVFGISAVVSKKVDPAASGLVVGGSLLLGTALAGTWSAGILNPAVALGIGSFDLFYVLGPIIGGIIAAMTYRWMVSR